MKKAQISGEVLIFVLALIVTAAILLFGYNAIKNLQAQQQKIELIAFQNNLKDAVEKTSYGSSKRLPLVMPSGYSELCLIDRDLKPSNSELEGENMIIYDSWYTGGSNENAFLLKSGSLTPQSSFYVGNISVDGDGNGEDDRTQSAGEGAYGNLGFLCIKPSGSALSLIIEGKGRHALIYK